MFKIGDLVTAIQNSGYSITNDHSVCRVAELRPNDIKDILVEIVEHELFPDRIGGRFDVESKLFVKYVKTKHKQIKSWTLK